MMKFSAKGGEHSRDRVLLPLSLRGGNRGKRGDSEIDIPQERNMKHSDLYGERGNVPSVRSGGPLHRETYFTVIVSRNGRGALILGVRKNLNQKRGVTEAGTGCINLLRELWGVRGLSNASLVQ